MEQVLKNSKKVIIDSEKQGVVPICRSTKSVNRRSREVDP